MSRKFLLTGLLSTLALTACNDQGGQQAPSNQTSIKVRAPEQDELHKLDAFNLAIALKRAIYDAGYTCKRITDAGYVGEYQNLDMWMAHCEYEKGSPRDWAVFAGPDGGAQVRDCKDIPGTGLPDCVIKTRPKGSFTELKTAAPKASK
jgi:hypothetical protein